MDVFNTLSKIDVSDFTEKKGQFSYLSWADAVNVLLKHFPEATWSVVKNSEGLPYTNSPAGCFVEVEVTIDGVSRSQIHPILDHRNKTVKEPDAFQVNTSIQRALAKAISLHGLGLYIYRGEDFPETEKEKAHRFKNGEADEIQKQVRKYLNNGDEIGLKQILDEYSTPEEKMKVWALFSSTERSTIKALLSEAA